MVSKGLSQREMADLLGVSLDRIKSLTSGRVKKLAPQETRAMVEKLHVRGDYLATGQGPVFQSEGEIQLEARLGALKQSTTAVKDLELPVREGQFVRDILYGVAVRDSALLAEAIDAYVAERCADIKGRRPKSRRGAS